MDFLSSLLVLNVGPSESPRMDPPGRRRRRRRWIALRGVFVFSSLKVHFVLVCVHKTRIFASSTHFQVLPFFSIDFWFSQDFVRCFRYIKFCALSAYNIFSLLSKYIFIFIILFSCSYYLCLLQILEKNSSYFCKEKKWWWYNFTIGYLFLTIKSSLLS